MAKPITGRCEAGVGVNYHGPAPVIQKCGQPGVLRPDIFKPFGVILCDDCDRDTREKRDNATS